jgi:hypothetical protein
MAAFGAPHPAAATPTMLAAAAPPTLFARASSA